MALTLGEEGILQREAGKALILTSGLLSWDSTEQRFAATPEVAFERRSTRLHPEFGRLMCWIMFSAGAEFFGKGACLLNSIEVRKFKNSEISDFGKMKTLVERHFPKLFLARDATSKQESTVREGYKLLHTLIRNRDAHAYHKGVRQENFPLVESHLLGAFNTLLDWCD
jgi:hypothetical protein